MRSGVEFCYGNSTYSRHGHFARRIFRVLSLREKTGEAAAKYRDVNPLDLLIRRTLCFYREQKEPIQQVAYNNPQFVTFLRANLKELETKIENAILDWQLERQQRTKYEAQLQKNQNLVDAIRKEAENDARISFERLSSSARKKVQVP